MSIAESPQAGPSRLLRRVRNAILALGAVSTVALFLGLAACQTVETTEPGAVGVDRKQKMIVSSEQVDQAAAQAYEQELQKARQKGVLDRDSRLLQRVRGITQRLVPQTRVFRDDAVNWNWEVHVLDSKELNAYAMPGGKIMVYTGLVERLDLSDDEIAAVIGHEIAHALREHSRERVSRAYAQQLALVGAAAVAGVGEGALNLANMIATVTFQLPHSREQEAEADRIGLELMARSGYNPQSAVNIWRKMEQAKQGGPPEFLSTHPSGESRIEELEALLPKVTPLYQASAGRSR
jgi:predicted Zn-dependent protease